MRTLQLQAGHTLIIFQSSASDRALIFSNSGNVFSVYLAMPRELLEERDAGGVCVNGVVYGKELWSVLRLLYNICLE